MRNAISLYDPNALGSTVLFVRNIFLWTRSALIAACKSATEINSTSLKKKENNERKV